MIKTLQKKFILGAMTAITILLVLLLSGINIGNIYTNQQRNRQTIESLLNSETMMHAPPDKHKGFLFAPMDENSRMSAVYFTVRVDSVNEIIKIDTGRIAGVSDTDAAELVQSVIDTGNSEGRIQHFLYKTANNERDGSRVYLFLDTSLQLRNIVTVLFFSLIAGLACWLAMLLLVVFIAKRAIRPIAENLNRQKQFVTDAGHEIKTPLAIILANTEAMELYQGESKWSKNIKEQTVRLNGLMQNLLTLAKADESRNALPTQAVSVSDAVSESLQMFAESMNLKEIELHQDVDDGIEIKANREQIMQLFSILLDNAVKYSPQNGEICVSLGRKNRAVVFWVENTCDALPECPPEKLFDRFYRADAARTQQNGGYGIGLSAAKTIAELYGGTVKAAYRQPDRISFTVVFS